jgi:hypothetical protein
MNNNDFSAFLAAIKKSEPLTEAETADLLKRLLSAVMEHDKRLIVLEKRH